MVQLVDVLNTFKVQAFFVCIQVKVLYEFSVRDVLFVLLVFIEGLTRESVTAVDISLLFAGLVHEDGVNFPRKGTTA